MLNLSRAIDLVGKLSRTKKYPADDEGVMNLAQGLQKASDSTQVGAGRIIERCASISEWCPTDAELLTVARDLAREDAVANGTYDSMAGHSSNVNSERQPCAVCENTGWETAYTLHTPVNGNWKQAKRENITQAAYDEISRKMNAEIWEKQRIYSGARRCTACTPKAIEKTK